MLTVHIAGQAQAVVVSGNDALPAKGIWYDLNNPDASEVQRVEAATGLQIPEREQIRGYDLSNRRRLTDRAVRVHMALYADNDGKETTCTPTGVMASHDALVTLRFGAADAIDQAAKRMRDEHVNTGIAAFATLLETVANEVAEQMQDIGSDMGELSTHIFVKQRLHTRELHRLMLQVGKLEGRLARYRTSLLGIARMVDFVNQQPPAWLPKAEQARLKVVENDLQTLDKFDEQLTGKLQFLLDATLGFINTAQNGVMKLLTVASVVTLPPMILAGIWGMNFKHMPDLLPTWAYPVALLVIGLSTVVPLVLFWRNGWLSRD